MEESVTVDPESGDLYIEGLASDFDLDRQGEAFEPGAFQKGLKSFMDTNPILLYHHKFDQALGQVVAADLSPEGLHVKARVDKPATGSWAEDVFNKIRRGTVKAFSVGGIFKRHMTPKGPRIFDVDLGEVSVTPFPVNPRTTFAVVAGKAFEGIEIPDKPNVEGEVRGEDEEMAAHAASLLKNIFDQIERRNELRRPTVTSI